MGDPTRPRPRRLVPVLPTIARALALVALLAVVAGCERGGNGRPDEAPPRAPGDAAREWAVGVDRIRAQLARKEWTSLAGSDTAHLSGFAAGDTLELAREVVTRGDGGRDAARYYFQGAQLRYYEMEGERAENAGTRQKVRLVLAFDERGSIAQSSYLVDGGIAPLDPATVRAVVARATEVARQWATAPATASPR